MNDTILDANLAAVGNKAMAGGIIGSFISSFYGLDTASQVGIVVAIVGLIVTTAAKIHEMYTRHADSKQKKVLHDAELATKKAEREYYERLSSE